MSRPSAEDAIANVPTLESARRAVIARDTAIDTLARNAAHDYAGRGPQDEKRDHHITRSTYQVGTFAP